MADPTLDPNDPQNQIGQPPAALNPGPSTMPRTLLTGAYRGIRSDAPPGQVSQPGGIPQGPDQVSDGSSAGFTPLGRTPSPMMQNIRDMNAAVMREQGSASGAPLPGYAPDRTATFNADNAANIANNAQPRFNPNPYPDTVSIRNQAGTLPADPGILASAPVAPPIAVSADAPPTPSTPTGPGVSTIGNGAAGNPTATDGELAGLQRNLDQYGPGVHGPNGGGSADMGGSFLRDTQARSDRMDRQANSRQLLDAGRGRNGVVSPAAISAAAQAMNAAAPGSDNTTQERIAGLRDRGETTRANQQNLTNQLIHRDDNNVSLRGQDTVLAGHRMANDVARAQMQREQFNADRTYGAGRTDAANALSGQEETQRLASQKALPDTIAGMLPPGADGKPDLANAARHAQGVNDAVAQIAKTTTDPAVKDKLNRFGVGALDQGDLQRIVAGTQLRDVVDSTATNGFTPWGTRAIASNQPILQIKKQPNGDYMTNRTGVNGESEIIPARYIEKQGSTLGFGGKPTDAFKSLMAGGQ